MNEWIPIEKKAPPKNGKEILVYVNGYYPRCEIVKWFKDRWCSLDLNTFYQESCFVAWMPLPEAPKNNND